ncbi:hypothetical protein ACDJ44_03300 [Proteus mirabilis]|uniref:hypothetical protein n=1 Tax=Proteus mirabilis TaxID=584 RepID=UPI001F36901C|nr:hypothetical protein [Proteus mirabilis]MCL8566224.1 hypothetical protein [Proteus mirabilis]MCL8626619.1 hypothetical protein [Proteus mirabilis]MCL8634064.1 hypothetical protein [Proteus mirabilis]MDC9760019.1 hypothetical protein [Proteus mirabilis]MDF7122262.1 hypothetical protein [Proteus mirabilis]
MMNIQAKRDIAHKTKILNNAGESKNIAKTCRHWLSDTKKPLTKKWLNMLI